MFGLSSCLLHTLVHGTHSPWSHLWASDTPFFQASLTSICVFQNRLESPGPQVPIWEVSVPLPWTDFLWILLIYLTIVFFTGFGLPRSLALFFILRLILYPRFLLISVKKCWGKLGRCRIMCEEGELFYILCNAEAKCCVNPKYVAINTGFSNYTGSLE